MRGILLVLVIVALCTLSLSGCPGRGAEPEPTLPPDAPPPPVDESDAVGVSSIGGEGDMGLYTDPGDLPPLPLAEATIRYADLDGDGEREAIAVGVLGEGEDEKQSVSILVARYDDERGDWQRLAVLSAGRGETQYDDDSIFLAYDMARDGVIEVGILLYEGEGATRGYNCYIYKFRDDELQPALHPLVAAVLGAVTWAEGGGATVADVSDQFSGDELVVAGRRKHPDEDGPSAFEMHVYGWAEEGFGPYLWYVSEQEFADADSAMAAFLNHEGGYRLDNYEAQYYDPEQDDRWDPEQAQTR